jgi:thymidylate kinase
MIIIAEGCDNVGKDYLLDKFAKSCPNTHFKKIHATRETPNNFEYFRSIIASNDDILMSRAWYGQFVYQTSEERRDNGWLTYSQMHDLEYMLSKKQYMLFNVVTDPAVCLHMCRKDKNDSHYTLAYIKDIMNKFDKLFKTSELEVVTYYNDFKPLDYQKDMSSTNWSSLPKIVAVDFDGSLVSDEFPNIGAIVNHRLIEELFYGKYKDYKKILFTTRTGEYLDEAVKFCNSNGWKFDAINENIEEVKNITGTDCRKVYADIYLDDKAQKVIW